MGVSVYHVGFQPGRGMQAGEYQVLSQAMYTARMNAINRLIAETVKVGGDGVIGVKLGYRAHSADALEFTAIGTAVRHRDGTAAHRQPSGAPFTSHLDAKELYQLLNVGWCPVSFVLGTCVYHIAVQGVMQTMRQVGQNVELTQWTQGFYDAREIAMTRLQAEGERDGAPGRRRRHGHRRASGSGAATRSSSTCGHVGAPHQQRARPAATRSSSPPADRAACRPPTPHKFTS